MNEERHWIITFSNGHCDCYQEAEFIGTYEGAIDYANEMLRKYAESMSHAAFGWGEVYTEEEYKDYLEDCSYDIEEREEEEDD